MSTVTNTAAPQFIVLPLTGLQIHRRLPLVHLAETERSVVWKAALALAGKPPQPNALLPLLRDHIACDRLLQSSDWFACSSNDTVFFRLLRVGTDLAIDLVIDTQSGAGRMVNNRVECALQSGMMFARKRHHLASFVVVPNHQPRNIPGSLVMDFGTTATTFIFASQGAPPLDARPLLLHNPFDPDDSDVERRPPAEKAIFRSTALLLRVPENPASEAWLLLGKAAEERIAHLDPLITSLYAPKKYVRDWPEHLRSQEPATAVRGVLGHRIGLVSVLHFVEQVVKQMLTLAVSSQVNPQFASIQPRGYPQVKEVLLTYPLTWREQEKALFQQMVQAAARAQFVLPDTERDQLQVNLVCSEPVAVAAYVLWEVFFHYFHLAPGGRNLARPSLVSSLLGNTDGEQELRLLVVDIGGGSTDIALVRASWTLEEDNAVNVHLRVLESLRYNCAGDRLSHILATAILTFMCHKYNIKEVLDYEAPATNPAFTRQYKRVVVSLLCRLAEEAKVHLATHPHEPWVLKEDHPAANELARWLEPARGLSDVLPAGGTDQVEISLDVLRHWVTEDRQSMKSRGKPGFMDIFFDLEELARSLKETRESPHLVLLSGRTTRLPFLRELAMKHLGLPAHRVRTLDTLLPASLHGPDHANIDKLAVVHGAHRIRFGHPIRFIPHAEEPVFRRYVGILQQTPMGLRLHQVLARPGAAQPQTCPLRVGPGAVILIGHAFRVDSNRAEVIATVENTTNDWRDIEVDLLTDYRVELKRSRNAEGVRVTERVPGGEDVIADNFNDTGRIDREPDGLLRNIVLSNADDWMKSSSQ
jgi:hypothetical protein